MARTWKSTSVRHGTISGHRLHIELKERPCDPCYAAKREYDRSRKTAPYQTLISRLNARAQTMAHTQMRHNHPKEYKDLYAANKFQLLIERAEEIAIAKTTN